MKRKIDRFKGMSEEEVMTKTLPDLLEYNLDYVIVSFPVQLFEWSQIICVFERFKKTCAALFPRLVSTQD